MTATPQALIQEFRAKAWHHGQLFDNAEFVLQVLKSEGYKLGIITNGSKQSQYAIRNIGE